MRQVIKHRDIRLLNMIRRTDPVIPVKALCPAPLMQNYMIKSVKINKKSIFREQFSWKVSIFATQLTIATFCCSIILPNCDLERDLRANNTTLKLRTIAQTSSIVVLGLSQAWQDIWDGVCAFFMPIPIVLPPTRL